MVELLREDDLGQASFIMSAPATSGELVCTMGFRAEGVDAQGIADKLGNLWRVDIMGSISSKVKMVECKIVRRESGLNQITESFADTGIAGGAAADHLPANTAILVQKRTGVAGRRFRGRFYLPGVPTSARLSDDDPNTLSVSYVSSLQTQFDAFRTHLLSSGGAGTITPVILHPTGEPLYTVITSFSVQARLGTQRTRLRD